MRKESRVIKYFPMSWNLRRIRRIVKKEGTDRWEEIRS